MANGSLLLQSSNYLKEIGSTTNNTNGGNAYLRDLTTAVASEDFTFEAWIYLLNHSALSTIFSKDALTSSVPSVLFGVQSAGRMIFTSNLLEYGGDTAQPLVPLNTWCHVAYVRKNGVLRMYCNGVGGAPISLALDFQDYGEARVGRGRGDVSPNYLTGYISNLRLVVGEAVYNTDNSTLTVPTQQLEKLSPTETAVGGSAGFGGTTTSFVEVVNNSGLNLSGSQYTLELWLYPTSTGTERRVVNKNGASTFGYTLLLSSAGVVTFRTDNTTITSTASAPINKWTHIAVTNDGTTTRLFVNGQLTNSVTGVTIANEAVNLRIGSRLSDGTLSFNGYIHSLRIVKGSALYTNTFSLPTAPLTNISGTSLLLFTDSSAGILDESSNCNILTTDTNTQKTNFSPFMPKTRLLMLKDLEIPEVPTTQGVAQPNVISSSTLFTGTSTSFLEVENNPGLNLSGSAYTIEMWVYPTGLGTAERRVLNKNGASTFGYLVTLSTTGAVQFRTDSTNMSTGTLTAPLNAWTHIAITNDGTVTRIFVNGRLSQSATGVTITNENVNLRIGNRLHDGTLPYQGYLSNVRIIKGTALYTKTFVPSLVPLEPTAETSLLASTGTAVYLPRFRDISANAFTPTITGNTTTTTFSPFTPGYYSNFFSGTSSHLTVTNSSELQLAGSQYTIELWVYPTGATGTQRKVLNKNGASTFGYSLEIAATTGIVQFFTDNTNLNGGTLTAPVNTWTHIAVTNDGTTTRLFVNGQLSTSATGVVITNEAVNLRIGARLSDATGGFAGNISNVRIVKGSALYTDAFTPSTVPLTAVTNTSLLTCNSANNFLDTSSFAHAITAATVTVDNREPFVLPANIVPLGGGFFDGTGDYGTFADNTLLDMEAQNFTIETWVYPQGTTTSGLFAKRATTATFAGVNIDLTNGVTPQLLVTVNGTSWGINTASSVSLNANRWNHVAVSRNGSTWTLFVNGQVGITATLAGTVPNNTTALAIGCRAADGAGTFTGHISNFRVVKGTSVYDAAFTPNFTTPLSAITNTSLLTLTYSGINLDSTNKSYIYTTNTVAPTSDTSLHPWSATYTTPVQHDISFKDYSVFNKQGIMANSGNTLMVYNNPFDNQTLQNQSLDPNSTDDADSFENPRNISQVAKYLTITTSDALNDRGVISPDRELQTIYTSA